MLASIKFNISLEEFFFFWNLHAMKHHLNLIRKLGGVKFRLNIH